MKRSISRRSAVSGIATGILSGVPEKSAFGGQGSTPVSPLYTVGTLNDLVRSVPPSTEEFVFVMGALRPGVGGALYRRVENEPRHAGKVRSADKTWWEFVPGDAVNVLQFGAIGDGRQDDSVAIQSALDYAIYFEGAPKRVFLPALPYSIGEVLHIGYGDRFVTVEVLGELNLQSKGRKAPGLYPRFNDRPCINIQGARAVRLRGLSLFGVNRDHVVKNYDSFPDRGRRIEWSGRSLGPTSGSRHAPYAGITVDAYSGPAPPTAYPKVRYPSFVDLETQYDKNYSSDILFENCRIEGFYVAVAVQPGLVPDASNGDFISYRDCSFNFNVVGIADGHSDSRCNNIENVRLHFNHTAIDTLTFGPGTGLFIGNVCGSSFDNSWQILNINIGGSPIQGAFPLRFDGCYGESLYHLGTAYTSGSGASGISFDGCKFEFSTKNQEFSPAALLSCRAGLVAFRNSVFQGGLGFVHFDAAVELDSVAFSHLQSEVFDTNTAAGRLAKSFTAGVWANSFRAVRLLPNVFYDFSGEALDFVRTLGLDSHAFSIAREASSNSGGRPIPHWVRLLTDEVSVFPVGHIASLSLDRSEDRVTISSAQGVEYDASIPQSWLSRLSKKGLDARFVVGPGDIIEDCDLGIFVYVVKAQFSSRSDDEVGAILRVRQINCIRSPDGGVTWELERSVDSSKGMLKFHNARRVYPYDSRAMIETEKSKSRVRLTVGDTLAGDGSRKCFVSKGDYIISTRLGSSPNERLFDCARVVDVDPRSGTVILDTYAARDFWGDSSLFLKA